MYLGFHPITFFLGDVNIGVGNQRQRRPRAYRRGFQRKRISMKFTHHFAVGLASMIFASQGVARATETDERIESAFTSSYVYKTYLHDDAVKAHSKGGDVVLTGKVSQESHKELAQETASNLPGVVKVENRIQVRGKPPAKNSDSWIQMKVSTTLLFHRNVNAHATDLDVKDGIVTLRGKAENQAQKDLTAEYANDVQGVKSVKNEMTVSPASPSTVEKAKDVVDDASITSLVKMTLLSHRSTSAMNTHVKTQDGVVTLTGTAGNGAERDLAAKFAEDVNGVKSINNEMKLSTDAPGK